MATITNHTRRQIVLPTKITIERDATITVENIDITNRDNLPTITSSVACGDLSYVLDPEDDPAPAEAIADPAPEMAADTTTKPPDKTPAKGLK